MLEPGEVGTLDTICCIHVRRVLLLLFHHIITSSSSSQTGASLPEPEHVHVADVDDKCESKKESGSKMIHYPAVQLSGPDSPGEAVRRAEARAHTGAVALGAGAGA